MTLSIIIVNYNVRYFLEQCLYSVQLSSKKIKTEVFIVDNNSVDGSVEMIENKYKLIDKDVLQFGYKTSDGFHSELLLFKKIKGN